MRKKNGMYVIHGGSETINHSDTYSLNLQPRIALRGMFGMHMLFVI